MIILPDTSTTLEVKLAGAVASAQSNVVVDYHDSTSTTHEAGLQTSDTNSTTIVTICAAPAASTKRHIETISLTNRDTAAITATFSLNDGSVTVVLFKCTLQVGDCVQYEHGGKGWRTLNGIGWIKEAAPLSGYRLMGAPIFHTGGGVTWTLPVPFEASLIEYELQAGGGAGGPGQTTGSGVSCGAGGGGGGYAHGFITTSATVTTLAATAGNGGGTTSSGQAKGADGASATVVYNGTTYSAGGGIGGDRGARTTGTTATKGGGANAGSVSGSAYAASGYPGDPSFVVGGTNLRSGQGGKALYGSGGLTTNVGNTNGVPGTLGGGGSGGCTSTGSGGSGGAGGDGFAIIRLYTLQP